MSKITLEQLMALHGLEDGDRFTIDSSRYSQEFMIKDGQLLYGDVKQCIYGNFNPCVFLSNEQITITKKAPWAPKKGEGYYGLYTVVDAFSNTGLDTAPQMLFDCGCIFKTSEEAEARRQELIKWMKESAK